MFNVARYLYKNRRNLIGYMDVHAYSQLWMTPWGYTRRYPKDYAEMVGFRIISPESLLLLKNRDLFAGPALKLLDSQNSHQI